MQKTKNIIVKFMKKKQKKSLGAEFSDGTFTWNITTKTQTFKLKWIKDPKTGKKIPVMRLEEK